MLSKVMGALCTFPCYNAPISAMLQEGATMHRPLILVTGVLIVLLLAIPASALHVLSPADDSPLLGPSFPISTAPGVQGDTSRRLQRHQR